MTSHTHTHTHAHAHTHTHTQSTVYFSGNINSAGDLLNCLWGGLCGWPCLL